MAEQHLNGAQAPKPPSRSLARRGTGNLAVKRRHAFEATQRGCCALSFARKFMLRDSAFYCVQIVLYCAERFSRNKELRPCQTSGESFAEEFHFFGNPY